MLALPCSNSFVLAIRSHLRDENLLDETIPAPELSADALISIEMIKSAVATLQDNTAFLSDFPILSENIPVVQTNVNELIAGADRTIADLFDLTNWADNLSATPLPNNTDTGMMALSEVLNQMRGAVSSVMKPDLLPAQLPTVPDLSKFQPPPVSSGNNCNGNDRAISIDINNNAGLEITICTFLDFELEGTLSAEGLLDELEESISLELDAGYVLKGALSTGVKLTVPSLNESPSIQLDPILVQLYLQSDLSGSVSLGLITAAASGNALMQGSFSLGYCPDCDGTYPADGYQRAGANSTFYFSREIGYDLDGALSLTAGMPGVEVGAGVRIGIADDNVFDDTSPVIQLPNAQSLIDSMKFSPQTAVNMLQLVDSMLAQATGNKAFDARIPLLDTTVKNILSIGSVFTNAVFELFVMVQPFEDRATKSLIIKG